MSGGTDPRGVCKKKAKKRVRVSAFCFGLFFFGGLGESDGGGGDSGFGKKKEESVLFVFLPFHDERVLSSKLHDERVLSSKTCVSL